MPPATASHLSSEPVEPAPRVAGFESIAANAAATQSVAPLRSPSGSDPSLDGVSHSPVDALVDKEGLQATFELFNRMSEDLASSYRALEGQVSSLTAELDRVNQQRERELKSKEQLSSRLSNLLDLLPGGVVVLDRWGAVSQINPAAVELLGEELVGRKWIEIIDEYFAPRKDDFHEISLKNGKRVSLSTRSLEVETGQIILLTDQTETRHLQEQVSRSERLSALGKMVSALAHQIRTPLSAAILYAGHLTERELKPEQTRRFSEKIVSRLNHLEQQVRDMLVFAKGDVKLTDSLTIGDLFDDLHHAVEIPLAANQAKLVVHNDYPGAQIICNRQTMVGALTNLINNALQASNAGADVVLKTRRDGRDIVIAVEDSGSGIPADIMQRLQSEEAFISTKSQGTGLGLAVVRAVVKAHHGEFTVESEQGLGTTASIKMPCLQMATQHLAIGQ